MLTTGLVSLNVHEALAFDGTEIVLNPDLFASDGLSAVNSISTAGGGRHGSSIRPASSGGQGAETTSKDGSQSAVTAQQGTANIATAPSTDAGKLAWGTGGASTASVRRLEVGDMIEIRVWDHVPLRDRNQSPGGVSSVFRKRGGASVHSNQSSAESVSTEAQTSNTRISKKGSNLSTPSAHTPNPTAPPIPIQNATSDLSRNMSTATQESSAHDSMQYSEDGTTLMTSSASSKLVKKDMEKGSLVAEALADNSDGTNKKSETTGLKNINDVRTGVNSLNDDQANIETSPAPPTKNVITVPSGQSTGGKPPTHARNRSNTADIPRVSITSAALPKPPLQPRASTHGDRASTHGDMNFAAYEARKRLSKPTHTREISDMTTDSMVHGMLQNVSQQQSQQQPNSDFNVLGVEVLDQQGSGHSREDDGDEFTQEDDALSIIEKTHKLRFSFVMLVTEKTLTSLKGSARTQVSMLRQVADLYKLSSYDMVSINRIEKNDQAAVLEAVSADFVLFSMKDQFISRGDMHMFQKALIGSWVYEGQRLTEVARGIKANARLIRHGNQPARSGIVTEETMITFRSRSSRIFWLVQISAEMWDYSSPYERHRGDENESVCEIYFDKWISFVHRLFDKWKAMEVTHSLTVVFFSRTFLSSRQAITINSDGGSLDCKDVYGRPFEDHYKTVIENETDTDWESLVVKLKAEFLRYPLEVDWNLSTGDLGRRPSNASQGNVLEAINLTTNLLQYHYLDRDLHRTGNSIVVISPGCGVFEVDKGLASITYQRMMDNGIGSDMLSLGLPPLHIAPFFLYNNEYRAVESRGVDTNETYYEIPHWMHLAFVSYKGEADNQPITYGTDQDSIAKQFDTADDEITIAANGFILPTRESSDSLPSRVKVEPNSPASFSVNGIAASSPEKRRPVSQERALNEGRDFLDILEACRPRNSNQIPSALQAILKMYRRSERFERNLSDLNAGEILEERGETDELKPLREWSSLDIDIEEPLNRVAGSRSGIFGPNEKHSERSDSSALSSPSSSYQSLVGVSFDRHLLGRVKGCAPLGGIHLQRSMSLLPVVPRTDGDADTVKSDGSWSTTGDDLMDEDLASSKVANKERNCRVSQIRKIMANHDSNYFKEPQVAVVTTVADAMAGRTVFPPLHESGGSPVNVGLPPQRVVVATRNEGHQSGGLGAALTHYSISNDLVGDSASNRFRIVNPTDSIGSARGFLSTQRPQLNSLGARAMSPLFLPPPGMGAGKDSPDLVRPEDRSIGSRLLPRPPFAGNTTYSVRSPANHILSGELFIDPNKGPHRVPSIGAGSGSPRGSSLYQNNTAKRNERQAPRLSSTHRHSHKKAFNPFRQADEDRVLAKRSHNRRRWSHVFPKGEIEFKRHAGPNWKSLTSPAILPISVDYFPSRQEIDQYFQFNIYNVTLSDFDNTPYETHADLLMEMVRQRITQDYQLVPPSCVDETIRRARTLGGGNAPFGMRGRPTSVISNPASENIDSAPKIKHFLTMGHQLQELTYDPGSDTIEVVRFNEKNAQNDQMNTFKYQYVLYSPFTQQYTKVVQTFTKYASQYNWNKVDRIICGDEDKTLRDGMRFRRLMYAVIPPKFSSTQEEDEFVGKFKRLSDYLCKLRKADNTTLEIKTSADPAPNLYETKDTTGEHSMLRSAVQLRKGKQDPFEWIELATDAEFSTTKSFRIAYNWLAASSYKVDTQVQLLHRRCIQYGLPLFFFPQTSFSRDLLLNPFKAPPTFCVRDEEKAKLLYTSLLDLDFVNDGVFYTQTKPILECIENGNEFDFGRRLSTAARQFVHRSGVLFVRLIRDRRGWLVVVVIPNSHHIKKDEAKFEPIAKKAFRDLANLVKEDEA